MAASIAVTVVSIVVESRATRFSVLPNTTPCVPDDVILPDGARSVTLLGAVPPSWYAAIGWISVRLPPVTVTLTTPSFVWIPGTVPVLS